ncbi:hypothetical protein [Kordia sp.]|uniref:hypothetical protein n=1 Tax=Kordia sp. TaxID=1965332 RepID=UPI003B597B20
MKKNILNIKGVSVISKENQSQINGGGSLNCGCDCAGRVTGGIKCYLANFACPQVYTCDDSQTS